MNLGAFSISLTVKNIHASKSFYENPGVYRLGGDINQKWLILKNGNALIGIFEGMFEKNMLTFNPGWDENAGKIDGFTDIRKLQQELESKDVKFETEADGKLQALQALS